MKNKKLLGNLLLLLTALIWGTAFVEQRTGVTVIEPATFTAARMALSAIMVSVVAFVMWRRKGRAAPAAGTAAEDRQAAGRSTVLGGVCCGFFLSAASILQQMGLVSTTAGKAGFITAMYMLLVPIISFIVFKKRYSWLVWSAVLLGVAGMYFLCVTDEFRLTRGDALVCGCALLFSCHILCCGHFVERGDPIPMAAIQFATATVLSFLAAILTETPSFEKIAAAALPLLYCGVVSGGIGYTLQIIAQKFTDPTIASLLMSMESVFAALAGALVLHERMRPRELLGCAMMFLAILLVQIPLPEKESSAAAVRDVTGC